MDYTHSSILTTYYAFTTLSTVGLGDLHPTSSFERILCSGIMLFGVMITSVIMESLSKMIKDLRDFLKDFNLSNELDTFFSSLQRFNGGKEIDPEKVTEFKAYFGYRWSSDRNLAVSTQQDQDLLEQLPRRVIISIYFRFLFKQFVDTYKLFFEPKKVLKIRRSNFSRSWF